MSDERVRIQTDGVYFWVEVRKKRWFRKGYSWHTPIVSIRYGSEWRAERDAEEYLRLHEPTTVKEIGRPSGDAELSELKASVPKWIPCEEKLPPEGHVVLMYSSDKLMEIGWLADADTWVIERNSPEDAPITCAVEDVHITHWHELPDEPLVEVRAENQKLASSEQTREPRG